MSSVSYFIFQSKHIKSSIGLWKLLNYLKSLKFEKNVELKATLINRPSIKRIHLSSQC